VPNQLRLSENRLEGHLPDFSQSPLEVFDVSSNSMCGSLPSALGSSITQLSVSSNLFCGTIPPGFSPPQLRALDISGNQLRGALPLPSRTSVIASLDASGNAFTGTIPSSYGLLQLGRLDLGRNRLRGTIPDLCGKGALQELLLSSNQLDGVAPPSLGRCHLLRRLELNSNRLSGAIPLTLRRLDRLNTLLLNANDFGAFELQSGLPSLVVFDISDNPKLVGKLSEVWWLLPRLQYLSIANTDLIGQFPLQMAKTGVVHLVDKGPGILCPDLNIANRRFIVSLSPHFYNYVLCHCKSGYAGVRGQCHPCPKGGDCTDGSMLLAKPGHWCVTKTRTPMRLCTIACAVLLATAATTTLPVVWKNSVPRVEPVVCVVFVSPAGHRLLSAPPVSKVTNATTRHGSFQCSLFFPWASCAFR